MKYHVKFILHLLGPYYLIYFHCLLVWEVFICYSIDYLLIHSKCYSLAIFNLYYGHRLCIRCCWHMSYGIMAHMSNFKKKVPFSDWKIETFFFIERFFWLLVLDFWGHRNIEKLVNPKKFMRFFFKWDFTSKNGKMSNTNIQTIKS